MSNLDPYEFGRQLILTKDLDPVYVLLFHSRMNRRKLKKWLLAYWAFYHVGTASWIVDSSDYWLAFETAAASKDYPRCAERRHYRGQNAINSVEWLKENFDDLFYEFDRAYYSKQIMAIEDVMRIVQTWVGFGPWIAFKVADMLERLGLVLVEFDRGSMFLFDSPKEGAEMMASIYSQEDASDVGEWAVTSILNHLALLRAPPRYERLLNVQEAETVLCKWKSYRNGRYHIGEDIAACSKALVRFPESITSQRLIAAGRRGGLWQ